MEHCVFAHTLSDGKDYRDCGRPCETHTVDLKDRVGEPHPLIPDVGCRNTVFNARAQSAAEYVPKMRELGIRHFRVELLREKPDEVVSLLDRYADVVRGSADPVSAIRSLRVINQLGVTRGTLDRE
jgi:putative protease